MATREVVRDAPSMPQLPEDPNVLVPGNVKAAAERAAAIHAAAYPTEEPVPVDPNAPINELAPPEPSIEPQPESIADPFGLAQPETPPAVVPAVAPLQPEAPPVADPDNAPFDAAVGAEQYHHRYQSMYGRWRATSAQLADMQAQMVEMSDALMQLQQGVHPSPAYPQPGPEVALVTDEDRATFGPELIDLATRIAKQAVAPDIASLKGETQQVRNRLKQTGALTVHQALDEALPNWRAVNMSTEFKAWLGLRDLYSGEVRQQLLNAAFQAADAPRVVAFFQGFVKDGIATGSIAQPQTTLEPPPAPRQPAMSLEMLAAPGRAKPASGEGPAVPAEKPVFTRAQISGFYNDVRAGRWAGREVDKARLEQSIFLAQREGRIR